jgi:PAS domain S-box-containing protein
MQVLIDLFSLKDLIPHGYCLAWSPLLLWLTIISDTLITLSYYLMPLIMFYFIFQRKNLLYSKLIQLIALFIIACGTTHLLSLITIWIPVYGVETLTKVITAIISVITTASMFYSVPKLLALPTTEQLEQEILKSTVAEKTALESRDRLQQIIDSIPVHIYVKDSSLNYQYINKAVQTYFDLDKDTIIGRSAEQLFEDESMRTKLRESDQLVLETGLPIEYEIFEPKKKLTFLTHKQPLLNAAGFINGLCVTALDITNIKLINQQLQEKEILWKFTTEGMGDGFWDWNMETNTVYYSPVLESMLGYSENELIPNLHTFNELLLHPDDKAKVYETLDNYLKSTTPIYHNEFRMRCKDGSYQWHLSRGLVIAYNDFGKPLRMVGTHSDITTRKKMEERLLLMNTALSTINQCVIITDHQQNIIWVNDAFTLLSGYSPTEAIGKNCRFLQGPLTEKEVIKQIRTKLTNAEPYHGEIINHHKNGNSFINQLTILPIFNDQNSLTHFVSTCQDITNIKQAHSVLRQGQLLAEQANTIKSQFLAMMSHEIRTPLSAIIGMQELLTNTPLDEKQLNYVLTMQEAGANLLQLTNDILDLTKVESGMLELEMLDFDVAALIEVCIKLMSVKAAEKDLALHSVIEADANTWINGDPLRFRQVLLNLLSNAIKFTESGSITVKLSTQPATDNDQALLVEVIDTGIGIAADIQQKLFKVFTQGDVSDTRKYGGSGLGLTISKRLVELWGGNIGLDSTPAVGSRFWFSVGTPITKPATTVLAQDNNDLPSHSKLNVNVLIVDDNVFVQTVLAETLRNAGHQVDLADSGQEAIKAVSEKSYDIIFMDISMPEMTGIEATKAIRLLGGAATSVPIIGITANTLALEGEDYLAAGMNDYLTKPIPLEALLRVINTACSQTAV